MKNVVAAAALVVLTACLSVEDGDTEQVAENGQNAQVCELPESVTVTEADGGSSGAKILLNEDSSLSRDWVVIHDARLPVDFEGTPGATTGIRAFLRGNFEYEYNVQATLVASQLITAVNVRFIAFDVFGEHVTTLGATEVVDLAPGEPSRFDWRWRAGDNDAYAHFATVGFIARVRTADGQVHHADSNTIVCVAALFALAATVADLDPGGSLIAAP